MWSSEGSVELSLGGMPVDDVKTTPFERRFNPYDFNGGYVRFYIFIVCILMKERCHLYIELFFDFLRTTVVIAGDDYAISAACTRMSTGYEILSRSQTKLFQLYATQNKQK